MNELDKLAQKYGADKWGKHHYTPVYYEMFKDRRVAYKPFNEKVPLPPSIRRIQGGIAKVLEIGVAEGASLFMWREFFPEAMIFGMDNDWKRIFRDKRIRVFEGDQSETEDLLLIEKLTGTDLDLVIDDGSHKPVDQLRTCLTLMPILNEDVTYVIEDVADTDFLVKGLYHYDFKVIECGKRYDDRLIIVKHKK